jgi:DNA-binding HxlR family transcriptional regulator
MMQEKIYKLKPVEPENTFLKRMQEGLDKTAGDVLEEIDFTILEKLNSSSEIYFQEDLAAAINISRRNLQDRLKKLTECKYVDKPPGKQRGIEITYRGIAILYRNPKTKTRPRLKLTIEGCTCGKAKIKLIYRPTEKSDC